jgi:protein SCO1/2
VTGPLPENNLLRIACLALLWLAACSGRVEWRGTDVTGTLPDLAFELLGSDGETVRAEVFRGHATLMYFGFTSCPDACPTTLRQIGVALEALGPGTADEIQVLLVSVDPGRDTPQAMKRYTESFGPWLHGLTGSERKLRALNHAYKVDFLAQEPDLAGRYDVMHSNRVFGFDAEGRCRVLLPDTADTEATVADLKQLLKLSD